MQYRIWSNTRIHGCTAKSRYSIHFPTSNTKSKTAENNNSNNLQRVKTINFGGEDKSLVKKPAKTKLLDNLKNDEVPASPKTPQKSKPINTLAATKLTLPANRSNDVSTNSRKSLANNSMTKKSTSGTQARKTMNGSIEQPTNTIRAMFQKQMEKSRSANDSISDQLAAIDLAKMPSPPKPSETLFMPGSLHKRVTRRNSLSQTNGDAIETTPVQTPTKKVTSRKTMFTPRVSDVMEEDKASQAIATNTNKTVNETAAMDIDRTVSKTHNNAESSRRNSIIVDAPTEDINQKRWLLNSLGKRKTFYTPQALDETPMLESRVTPLVNRTCLRFTMNDTPGTQDLVKKSTPAADKTNTTPYGKCDNLVGVRFTSFSIPQISFNFQIGRKACRNLTMLHPVTVPQRRL